MVISALETFGIGVGPSSSHMVGPMRAAKEFVTGLLGHPATGALTGLHIRLGGSLAWTGAGHGTPAAVVAGLCGLDPEDADADRISSFVDATRRSGGVQVGGVSIPFDVDTDIVCDPHLTGEHPNVMELMAMNASCVVVRREFLSIGGGVVREPGAEAPNRRIVAPTHPFTTAVELLDLCRQHGLSISEVMRANELTAGTEVDWRRESVLVGTSCRARSTAAATLSTSSFQAASGSRDAPLDWRRSSSRRTA